MDDEYRGILWDIEELPYFKGAEMPDESKSGDMKVIEAFDLKFELEKQILKLLSDFEGATALSITGVSVMRNGEMGKCHGEVWGVEVEAIL
jgi:hypothetical protein